MARTYAASVPGIGTSAQIRQSVLAMSAATAILGVLLADLFAPRFAQPRIEWRGRKRLAVTLPWGIDGSPTEPRGRGYRLFRGGIARRGARAIQAIQIVIEIFERHIILADLPGANLPLTGIGVFDAGDYPRLEVLAFLRELFHALGICLLRIRQSLRIARLPSGMRVETSPPRASGDIGRGDQLRPARGRNCLFLA
jgi:hypothetical protein